MTSIRDALCTAILLVGTMIDGTRAAETPDANPIAPSEALMASIAALDEPKLEAADTVALAAIRVTLADYGNPKPAVRSGSWAT
jgi:hypothetical protein